MPCLQWNLPYEMYIIGMIMILFWLVTFSLVMSYFIQILFITLWGQIVKRLITRLNFILTKTFIMNKCHINICSIDANLSPFDNYLQLLSINFPVIAITETWLSGITCDFYPRPVLAFGYCRCLRLSVCVSVCAVITCLSAR